MRLTFHFQKTNPPIFSRPYGSLLSRIGCFSTTNPMRSTAMHRIPLDALPSLGEDFGFCAMQSAPVMPEAQKRIFTYHSTWKRTHRRRKSWNFVENDALKKVIVEKWRKTEVETQVNLNSSLFL
jgi:hypothetical protein